GPADFVAKLLELTGIREQYNKDDEESRARYENIGELLGAVAEYERMAETPTIEGFLEEAALVADVDGLREGTGSVTLMTMHSAKGLEFGAVFVTGMEEGLFPGTRAIFDEEKLEEERRLCYVAITRAKERLFFTNATRRMLYGAPQHNRPSRFLDELPETLVEKDDRSTPWPSEMQRFRTRGEEREKRERRELPRAGDTPTLRKPETANMAASASFAVGDAVRHRRYGQGMVVKMQGDVAHVAFPGLGIKEFDLRFAPMEKA
ncbi:MAG: ATP-binding domain-containing protein, partial [Christensenellaceae bacterium]|nr:ATP-binding domain-containing protein [Christensenellaceae bacterium]